MKNRLKEINTFVMPTTRKAAHELIEAHFNFLEGKKPFANERRWLKTHWTGFSLGLIGSAIVLISLNYPRLSLESLLPLFYGMLLVILGFVMDIWRSIE